ncbi:DUF6573 family protein [Kitasatospora sp. NPDC127060]|uniref:DUF6573 family protein n=1 Tax=Kitasatospora sp. NPDC127060 TaxID=3347121 RepID=UPI00365D62B0
MTDKTASDPMVELFGEPIHIYTRAQAMADGVLVEVPEAAQRQAGFGWPMALTAAVHARCVTWGGDEAMEASRLRALLWRANFAIRSSKSGKDLTSVPFVFAFAEVDSPDIDREVRLTVAAGPGDDGEPVLTVMFPHED